MIVLLTNSFVKMIKYYKDYGGSRMILYHGGIDIVDKPEIRKGDAFLDFGVGFYTTTSYEQAERWARIKMRRNNVMAGICSK